MKVFILAAGIGTRLKPLTNNQPKVMIKIGNKPVLEHLLNLCHHYSFNDIIINLHYLPEVITSYFGNGQKFGVKINYSFEKKIMGGAGALKQAEKLLKNDSFFVLNGDVMTNVDLIAIAKFHQEKAGLGCLLVHPTDHSFDSDLVEYDGKFRILRFFRSTVGDNIQPVSKTGTHIFKPAVLNFIPPRQKFSLEKQLIPVLLTAKQSLYAYYSNCYSKDMGTLERLAQVEKDYQNGKIYI